MNIRSYITVGQCSIHTLNHFLEFLGLQWRSLYDVPGSNSLVSSIDRLYMVIILGGTERVLKGQGKGGSGSSVGNTVGLLHIRGNPP